jgi:hypothetical protein
LNLPGANHDRAQEHKEVPMHTTHRTPDGRFEPGQSGNPFGRPRGARNRTTLAVEAVLDDRAADFVNRIIDSTQHGSFPAMRMCLDRVCPPRRGRPVVVDLPPLRTPEDVEAAATAIVADAACGDLTPHEAVEFFRVIEAYRRTIFGVQQMKRLAELEKRLAAQERAGKENTSEIQAAGDAAPADEAEPATEQNTSEIQADGDALGEMQNAKIQADTGEGALGSPNPPPPNPLMVRSERSERLEPSGTAPEGLASNPAAMVRDAARERGSSP